MSKITIKAMLKWLDGQRDAVNARIIASPPENQGRYMPELQVINAIAERVQEMTAVEYGKLHDEICDAYQHCMCALCPLGNNCISLDSYGDDIRRAVEIVKWWKEEQDD